MSLPESLGSIYESIARVWRGRFIAAARRPPTGKQVLCGYVSTTDRCIPVTAALIQAMITESGVTEADIATARDAAAQAVALAVREAQGEIIGVLFDDDSYLAVNPKRPDDLLFAGADHLGGFGGTDFDFLLHVWRR